MLCLLRRLHLSIIQSPHGQFVNGICRKGGRPRFRWGFILWYREVTISTTFPGRDTRRCVWGGGIRGWSGEDAPPPNYYYVLCFHALKNYPLLQPCGWMKMDIVSSLWIPTTKLLKANNKIPFLSRSPSLLHYSLLQRPIYHISIRKLHFVMLERKRPKVVCDRGPSMRGYVANILRLVYNLFTNRAHCRPAFLFSAWHAVYSIMLCHLSFVHIYFSIFRGYEMLNIEILVSCSCYYTSLSLIDYQYDALILYSVHHTLLLWMLQPIHRCPSFYVIRIFLIHLFELNGTNKVWKMA